MKPNLLGFIGTKEANYLQLLLSHPEPKGKEAALEALCAHYRAGRRLRDPHGTCQILTALLYHPAPSVRRWTFNAIALIGNKAQNLDATMDALGRNSGDEDIIAAGMAAVIALTDDREAHAQFQRLGVEIEGAVLLAAAQQAPSYRDKLSQRRVNLDEASSSELRLAAVLVGLQKAPEHLFTLSHQNSAVVGRLHGHSDKQVAQYAAWAVCEHPDLDITHLGFTADKIRDQVPDVRKYGVRLLSADDATAERHREHIAEASFDAEVKVREGLAAGLLNSYFDGLEEITVDWISREYDGRVRDGILDHFVSHSDRCAAYADMAVETYRNAATGSIIRARMEARAERKPIYADFRRIDHQSSSLDLFGAEAIPKGGLVVNKTYNINADRVGVVGDSSKIAGGFQQNTGLDAQDVQSLLSALIALLEKAGSEPQLQEGKKLASEAKAEPTKGRIAKLLSWMTALKTASGLVVGGAEDFEKIHHALEKLGQVVSG